MEIAVVLAIFGILMPLLYGIFSNQFKYMAFQSDFADMDQKMKLALDVASRDIRVAGSDFGDNALFRPGLTATQDALTVTDSQSINVRYDPDGDGTIDSNKEDILIRLSGSRVMRNGITLADNVTSFYFTFVDQFGAAIDLATAQANPEFVTLINIFIETQSNTTDIHGNTVTRAMMTSAALLNR